MTREDSLSALTCAIIRAASKCETPEEAVVLAECLSDMAAQVRQIADVLRARRGDRPPLDHTDPIILEPSTST